jgi:hypothetical protein
VSGEERDQRRELEEDLAEDLELNDDAAEKVKGGDKAAPTITQDVTVNKAKTADKAFNAMDGYIRG